MRDICLVSVFGYLLLFVGRGHADDDLDQKHVLEALDDMASGAGSCPISFSCISYLSYVDIICFSGIFFHEH
jgi:hypothetical protein